MVSGYVIPEIQSQKTKCHLIKPACDYMIDTTHYELVKNGKHYAIHKKGTDEYLWVNSFGIEWMYITITEPTLFRDSCKAKAVLQEYHRQQLPKMKFETVK